MLFESRLDQILRGLAFPSDMRLVGLGVCSSVDQQSLARAAIRIRPYTTSPNISTYNNSRIAHSQDCNRNIHFQQRPRVGAPSHLHTAMINTLDTTTAKGASDKGSPSPKRSAHARAEQIVESCGCLGLLALLGILGGLPKLLVTHSARPRSRACPEIAALRCSEIASASAGFPRAKRLLPRLAWEELHRADGLGVALIGDWGSSIYLRGVACGGVLGRKI
jgi:hypothetical protein